MFERFHVCFMNPYGDRELMPDNSRYLQENAILVTPFSTVKGQAPYFSEGLNPESESSDEGSKRKAFGKILTGGLLWMTSTLGRESSRMN
jgi:hypothetical protein